MTSYTHIDLSKTDKLDWNNMEIETFEASEQID